MNRTLCIALPASADQTAWILNERAEPIRPLARSEEASHAGGCLALAPGACVAHFRIMLPVRSEREAAQAAIYAVEDEIAQPIEEVHLVLGPRPKAGEKRDVYVVDRALMQYWLDLLSQVGAVADRIVPQQCLLDTDTHRLKVADQIILPAGERIIAVETGLPEGAGLALGACGVGADRPDTCTLTGLAGHLGRSGSVNLLTGAFAPRRTRSETISAWKVTAAMAMAASTVWTGTVFLEAYNYHQAALRIEADARERYAILYPGSPPPQDLDRSTRGMLADRSLSARVGLAELSAGLYEILASSGPGWIESLDYQDATLTARLILPGIRSAGEAREVIMAASTGLTINYVREEDGIFVINLSAGGRQ